MVQDHCSRLDDRDDGRPDAVHRPQPAVPEPRRLQLGGKHDSRATDFQQPGRYGHGRDQESVSRPGLRYPVPGLNDGGFGLRVLWAPGEFRLAHPDPDPAAQHLREASAGPGGGTLSQSSEVITVGTVTGRGDAMMINESAERQLDMGTAGDLAPWTPLWQPPLPITVFRPIFGTDQTSQNVITTLDFFSGDNDHNALLPTLTLPRNRRTEAMHLETVDRALDGWSFNLQS